MARNLQKNQIKFRMDLLIDTGCLWMTDWRLERIRSPFSINEWMKAKHYIRRTQKITVLCNG